MFDTYLKPGFKVFLKFLICFFLAIMTFFSFVFIFSQVSTEEIGYKLFTYNEQTERYEYSYDFFYSDGEDEQLNELKKNGTKYELVKIRSEFKGATYNITMSIAQIFVLTAFCFMIYGSMYHRGDSDYNKVSFNRMSPNIWYGFKVGLLTGSPLLIVYIGLILSKLGIITDKFIGVFRTANYYLYFIVKLKIGDATLTSQLSWIRIILCGITVFIVPLVCELFYYMGYRQINIIEKIVYKKK